MQIRDYDKLKKGDTFVGKIQNEKYKEYNGGALILNVCDKYISEDFPDRKNLIVVVYLVKDYSKEFEFNKITEKNCICTKVIPLEDRFYPLNALIPIDEHFKNVENIPVYPDEDGRLFEYNYRILIEGAKDIFSKDLEYIGNYDLPIPKNNYVPFDDKVIVSNFVDSMTFKEYTEQLLNCYENNNKKNNDIFDIIQLSKYRKHLKKKLQEEVIFFRNLQKFEQDGSLSDFIKLKPNPNTEVDEETGDTLTYVGPPRDEEDISLR